MNFILNDTIQNCEDNYFHTFEYRCKYDIKYIGVANNGEIDSTVTHGYVEYKSDFYELKEIKNAHKNAFRFIEIIKVHDRN